MFVGCRYRILKSDFGSSLDHHLFWKQIMHSICMKYIVFSRYIDLQYVTTDEH
jgi:hypothetical protein